MHLLLQKQWTYTIWFLTIDHLPHPVNKGLALSLPTESFIITSSQSLDFLKPLCPWFLTDGCNCFCPFFRVIRVDHKWLTHWKFTQCFSKSGVSTNQNGKTSWHGLQCCQTKPLSSWWHDGHIDSTKQFSQFLFVFHKLFHNQLVLWNASLE